MLSPPDPAHHGGEGWATSLFRWDSSEGYLLRGKLSLSLDRNLRFFLCKHVTKKELLTLLVISTQIRGPSKLGSYDGIYSYGVRKKMYAQRYPGSRLLSNVTTSRDVADR